MRRCSAATQATASAAACTAFTPRPGAEEWPARPRTVTSAARRPLWPSTGCMPVGSPTMHSAGFCPLSARSAHRRRAPPQSTSSSYEMNRWIGRRSPAARKPGTAARQQATKPFMSAVPRPISRPSLRRMRNGSALQAWPSTGTTSTWPDSAMPPGPAGPIVACRFALVPVRVVAEAVRHAEPVQVVPHPLDQRQVGVAGRRVERDQPVEDVGAAQAGCIGHAAHPIRVGRGGNGGGRRQD